MKKRQRKRRLIAVIHENKVQLQEVGGIMGTPWKILDSRLGPAGHGPHLKRGKTVRPTKEMSAEGTKKEVSRVALGSNGPVPWSGRRLLLIHIRSPFLILKKPSFCKWL